MSARSLNRVQLIGNLTRDPEIRHTPSGTAVCTFGLATNRSWTPSDGGETQEDTEFHRLVARGKLAEICDQILNKGRKAYIEGRLQTRKWTGQDGVERQTTEIVVENMIALSQPRGSGSDYDDDYDSYGSDSSNSKSETTKDEKSESKSDSKSKAKKPKEAEAADEVDLDDIPF